MHRSVCRYTELHRYLITKEMEDVEDRVYKLVFRTFLRLSTYKESKVTREKPSRVFLAIHAFLFLGRRLTDVV